MAKSGSRFPEVCMKSSTWFEVAMLALILVASVARAAVGEADRPVRATSAAPLAAVTDAP